MSREQQEHGLCKVQSLSETIQYHLLVLFDIQSSFDYKVLLFLFFRVWCFNLREWFRCRPLLVCFLVRECHGNLKTVGPAATFHGFRVYFLEYDTWLEVVSKVSDVPKYIKCVLWVSHHGFHLTVDHILLKPTASILL